MIIQIAQFELKLKLRIFALVWKQSKLCDEENDTFFHS